MISCLGVKRSKKKKCFDEKVGAQKDHIKVKNPSRVNHCTLVKERHVMCQSIIRLYNQWHANRGSNNHSSNKLGRVRQRKFVPNIKRDKESWWTHFSLINIIFLPRLLSNVTKCSLAPGAVQQSSRTKAEAIVGLRRDGKVTFLLQALNGVVETLLYRRELKPQILELLVGELVWLHPWLHFIRTPAPIIPHQTLTVRKPIPSKAQQKQIRTIKKDKRAAGEPGLLSNHQLTM